MDREKFGNPFESGDETAKKPIEGGEGEEEKKFEEGKEGPLHEGEITEKTGLKNKEVFGGSKKKPKEGQEKQEEPVKNEEYFSELRNQASYRSRERVQKLFNIYREIQAITSQDLTNIFNTEQNIDTIKNENIRKLVQVAIDKKKQISIDYTNEIKRIEEERRSNLKNAIEQI